LQLCQKCPDPATDWGIYFWAASIIGLYYPFHILKFCRIRKTLCIEGIEMYERRSSPGLWAVFGVCALAGTALFFIPAYVIRPFSYQAPRALMVAMALRAHAPLWTTSAALLSLVFAFELWRTSNWWRRVIVVAAMIPLLFATVMARLNYFEWMFHPVDSPQFEAEAAS
jgi:hypothetical protein